MRPSANRWYSPRLRAIRNALLINSDSLRPWRLFEFHRTVKAPFGYCEPATFVLSLQACDLFCHCEPATFVLSLRACEAISLFVWPALNNRDRHVPRDDMLRRACEAISLFVWLAQNKQDRHVPRDDMLRRACEAISLFVWPALDKRDRHAALAMTKGLSLRACEAISLFVWPALNRQDRHVPRDDKIKSRRQI